MKDKPKTKLDPEKRVVEQKTKKSNEKYGLYFSSMLKITDTGTGKVILQKRCS